MFPNATIRTNLLGSEIISGEELPMYPQGQTNQSTTLRNILQFRGNMAGVPGHHGLADPATLPDLRTRLKHPDCRSIYAAGVHRMRRVLIV